MKPKSVLVVLTVVTICFGAFLWLATASGQRPAKLTYSQFFERVRAGEVASAVIRAGNVSSVICRFKDGSTMRTLLPSNYKEAMTAMQDRGVSIEIQDPSSEPQRVIANASPFLALLGIWLFLALRFRNTRLMS